MKIFHTIVPSWFHNSIFCSLHLWMWCNAFWPLSLKQTVFMFKHHTLSAPSVWIPSGDYKVAIHRKKKIWKNFRDRTFILLMNISVGYFASVFSFIPAKSFHLPTYRHVKNILLFAVDCATILDQAICFIWISDKWSISAVLAIKASHTTEQIFSPGN